MKARAFGMQRATVIWLLLLAITAASAGLAEGMASRDDRYSGAAIVALAFFKIRYVILDFMELRHAPRSLRLACEAWVVIVCATIVSIDLQG